MCVPLEMKFDYPYVSQCDTDCQFEYSIPSNWVFIKNNPYGSLIFKIYLIKRIWPPRSNIAERQAVVQNVPPSLTNKLSYPYETQEIQMTIIL